jgi:beta-glucuronidase
MLYPRATRHRQLVDLSGLWTFRLDRDGRGRQEGWTHGFEDGVPIVVPASWNDLVSGARGYFGEAWYQTDFVRPWGWDDRRTRIRFGSVNYRASVWLNGAWLGDHEGGHLPFEFEVDHLRSECNTLVVLVDGELDPHRVPSGRVRRDPLDNFMRPEQTPDTAHDFFPYCGIHRPVVLYATGQQALSELVVRTDVDGDAGRVHVRLRTEGAPEGVRVTASGHGQTVRGEAPVTGDRAELVLELPAARLWSPEAPHLYDLVVELTSGNAVVDSYPQAVGVRTVAVDGDRLLLNGHPVQLRGFGRHEDAPLAGRGYQPLALVKDHALMRWVGANSYRTSHYPYAEEALDLADRLGVLVIAETPCVEMYFHPDGLDERLRVWSAQTRALIERDRNHPCVIMWSLANEPHNRRPEAETRFADQFLLARSLDPTRPVTFVSYLGDEDAAIDLCDVIALNRYRGWYSEPGDIPAGVARLSAELDAIHARTGKPVFIGEFGVDTIPGLHAEPPVMFSEEYQVDFLDATLSLLATKPYVVGAHIWNLCDFATAQSITRVGGRNYKGLFTREREPKMAARRVRELWRASPPEEER